VGIRGDRRDLSFPNDKPVHGAYPQPRTRENSRPGKIHDKIPQPPIVAYSYLSTYFGT